MQIKEITDAELSKVVEIHNSAFQGFFLTQLGPTFLRLYYRSVLHSPQGIILGCFEENELCGFAAATKLARGFNTSLVKSNLFSYLCAGFKIVIKSPLAILRLAKIMTKKSESIDDDGSYAELLSIGVSLSYQRKGIGRQLLLALEENLGQQHIGQLSLTTDYYDNDKAIGFYKSLHYDVMYDFITYPNRRMYRMIKNLNS